MLHCREKAQAAKELLISVVEERLHQERSGRVAHSGLNDSENKGDITDGSVMSVLDTDEDSTWTQLLRGQQMTGLNRLTMPSWTRSHVI